MKHFMALASRIASLMLFILLASSVARAQIETGTIVGVVQDSTGGVVPNAAVALTHLATGVVRQTHTDAQGAFNAQFMPLGTYAIRLPQPGSRPKRSRESLCRSTKRPI